MVLIIFLLLLLSACFFLFRLSYLLCHFFWKTALTRYLFAPRQTEPVVHLVNRSLRGHTSG